MKPEEILDAADRESGTDPEKPTVPIGVTLTPGTTKALERYEAAYAEWVTADAALIAKFEEYGIASRDDQQKLEVAARKGEATRPEPTAPAMLPDLEYATKVSQARRRDVNDAVKKVADELAADAHLDRRIFESIEEALDVYEADVEAARQQWNAAHNKLSPILANLAIVQPRVAPIFAFDSRHAHLAVPQINWPEPRVIRHHAVRDLIGEMRRLMGKSQPEPVYPIREQ